MSLKMVDSCQGQRTYNNYKWTGAVTGITYTTAPTGQSGTWITISNNTYWRDDAYSGDTLICGWRVELPATAPAGQFVLGFFGEWTSGSLVLHVCVLVNASGYIEARLGSSSGTLLGTSSIITPWGSGCRYIEMKCKVGNSGGTVEVRLDEVVYLTASGLDTQNAGTAKCNAFQWMNYHQNGQNTNWKVRDFYVCGSDGSVNNDFLGVSTAGVKTVSGAGNSAQYTPSAGSNYQNVDDGTTVDNDTTYNESSTVNQKDTHALTSSGLPAGAVIRGTQSMVICKKTDTDPRSIATVIRSNSTDYDQTTLSLGTSYVGNKEVQEVDPNTAAAWTQSALDAIELGYKVIV